MTRAWPRVATHSRSRDVAAAREAFPRSGHPDLAVYLGRGQRIAGRYEVLGILGEGGMGVVYRCRDRSGELVAVKRVVLPESSPDEHLEWFLAEAQALSALCHDNIVRARDFGQLCDGTPYLAMDLVEGVSLQHLIAESVPFPLLFCLTDQILAALAHAHARGIVHGDLKPANVVVETGARSGPRARLFDFGLAKRYRRELDARLGQKCAPSHPPPSAGTPGYMAPEQILGRRSDIRPATDLYALGCILYRALSGRTPYSAEARGELDVHRLREPTRLEPEIDVSERVVDFVMRLLRTRPWERPASAAEVRARWRELSPMDLDLRGLELPGGARRSATPEPSSGLETTRRISPREESRTLSQKLRRSSAWLPGLLSLRPAPLVGRSALCRRLLDRLETVFSGRTERRAIVLTGPAGVGKSRLAEWLCAEVEEAGRAVALRGFREGRTGRDALALALADRYGLASSESCLLPVALSEPSLPDDLAEVVGWLSSDTSNVRTVPAMARVLADIAGRRPLVLWLDEPSSLTRESLALLAGLPELAPGLRLVVVTTARPEGMGVPGAVATIGALRASFELEFLPVPPLDSLTISAMLRVAHPIDSALALQIALASGGIPLDALARLFALAERGKIA